MNCTPLLAKLRKYLLACSAPIGSGPQLKALKGTGTEMGREKASVWNRWSKAGLKILGSLGREGGKGEGEPSHSVDTKNESPQNNSLHSNNKARIIFICYY